MPHSTVSLRKILKREVARALETFCDQVNCVTFKMGRTNKHKDIENFKRKKFDDSSGYAYSMDVGKQKNNS